MNTTYHVNRSLSQIEEILLETGFQIVKRIPQSVIMNSPADSENRLHELFWLAKVSLIQKSEFLGFLLGALQYPLELVLISLLKESPTTEIMICKKG